MPNQVLLPSGRVHKGARGQLENVRPLLALAEGLAHRAQDIPPWEVQTDTLEVPLSHQAEPGLDHTDMYTD
jgi:hypothetical protein